MTDNELLDLIKDLRWALMRATPKDGELARRFKIAVTETEKLLGFFSVFVVDRYGIRFDGKEKELDKKGRD